MSIFKQKFNINNKFKNEDKTTDLFESIKSFPPKLSSLLYTETSKNFEKDPDDCEKEFLMKIENGLNKLTKSKAIPLVLAKINENYTGIVKFYYKKNKYGFIGVDQFNGMEIFFHEDDIINCGKNGKKKRKCLSSSFHGNIVRTSFNCMIYVGKYEKSLKAININLII